MEVAGVKTGSLNQRGDLTHPRDSIRSAQDRLFTRLKRVQDDNPLKGIG